MPVLREDVWLGCHAALTDGEGGLQERFSADGGHVSRTAYRAMRGFLEQVFDDGVLPSAAEKASSRKD